MKGNTKKAILHYFLHIGLQLANKLSEYLLNYNSGREPFHLCTKPNAERDLDFG